MPIYRSLLAHLSGARLKRVVPKRVHNAMYRSFIRELTRQAIKDSGADDIFHTRPLPCNRRSPRKLWMVASSRDLLMILWSLKSLIVYSDVDWDIHLADGGGLSGSVCRSLEHHFPGIRILGRSELDAMATLPLRNFPWIHWLRFVRKFALSLKLVDLRLELPCEQVLLLDSDVLFFAKPNEILSRFDHLDTTYVSKWLFNMENGQLNSGLGVFRTSAIDFEQIESVLAEMTHEVRNGWTVEQDIYARISDSSLRLLPHTYAVEPVPEEAHGELVSCHYIGVCRHRFFARGVMRLRQQGFLQEIQRTSV